MQDSLNKKISSLRLIVTDFDGIWTDGKVVFSQNGEEGIVCSRKDSLRIKEVLGLGIKIFAISKEENPVVLARCEKIGIPCWNGVDDKLSLLKKLLLKEDVSSAEAAFVGDDVNDLNCLEYVGVPMTVADADERCKNAALYVTKRNGGDHAMREIFDLVLASRSAEIESPGRKMKAMRHAGIVVTDMEKSLKFYRDFLGLKVVWDKLESGDYIDKMSALKNVRVRTVKMIADSGSLIELLWYDSHQRKRVGKSEICNIGASHIAFTVENLDEIHKLLCKNGVKFNCEPQFPPGGKVKVTFCEDPDGTLIELVEVLKK